VETEVTPPRRVALETLRRVRRGELADRALAQVADGLEPRDHAWVQELVYGTFRLRGRLDYALGERVKGGIGTLEPDVLDVLRLGTYQLLEMGSVPEYAAVSQSVELVRAAGAPRAAGLVNGVLQAIRRGRESQAYPKFEEDPRAHLVAWGSHPAWLVDRWVGRWGAEEARALVEVNNTRPDLFISPVGIGVRDAIESLEREGIEAKVVPGFPDSVRILPGHSPTAVLSVVPAVVQDPAAAMVVRFADLPAGSVVYDVSAAPGGKAARLAERAGFVAAADLSIGRLRRVRANVRRVGFEERVGLVVADGRHPPFRPGNCVLLDAPCTGTGTFRRHADGRWRISPADIQALARLQRDLLAASAQVVAPGGLLVYATCSLEPEENEEQIEWFLEAVPGFRLKPPGSGVDGTMVRDGFLSLLPQRQGVDGAFAARLERVN
jgi:16S rRNA (cytosine967-C5)-methyltransferase